MYEADEITSYVSLREFVENWKKESDSFLESKDPIDIDDADERKTYNEEVGINTCLSVILDKLNHIEV